MTNLKFSKMHGLGNDFMVIDAINQTFEPRAEQIAQWANRYTGIGFDQLLVVEKAQSDDVDFRYRIFNADGGEVEQCGNGARCFVKFVTEQGLTDKPEIVVETARGIIKPRLNDDGLVTVNMGQPRFAPDDVPFVLRSGEKADDKTFIVVNGIDSAEMSLVSMGNPHAVMLVGDVATAPVENWGNALQNHARFPARVNVGFMQIVDAQHIKLRVFERGSGETQACGTGACAAVVSGVRLSLLTAGEPIRVSLPGGDLYISWQDGGDVMMTGPAVTVFTGEIAV
ncbi:diaminopimelate epimerase [Kingella kingae]|uniref:Diaminopimelate epimerase n=4 Tax=Kingella kingae TaxID=504 RepID=F5S7I7_KINKI|nr:diaminopimelate epimerase [Kingella kingae]EGK08969.1 diaminopimelate epimerase [Kingella kingae ATCC 23330]EIC13670.1 diaminopimelate epimerase [Kingella kingae PYKK081]MBD3614037.1 diaminopimelate epimerase [Kingella kingae]MBD3632382.1 diaminopimelate epimerase [Kingella kingae]MBD3659775.1 diaminopimelate epimerase [Kingella kingae]